MRLLSLFRRRMLVPFPLLVMSSFFWGGLSIAAAAPVGIGWTTYGNMTTAGYVAPDGRLILFDGGAAGWTLRSGAFPHFLVPGAPIALLPQSLGQLWPTVVTVSSNNKLVLIVNGGVPELLLPTQSFPVGAPLEVVQTGGQRIVLLVSAKGEIWSVDPVTRIGSKVNSPAETFPIGTTVSAVAAGGQYHAFAVDHFGTMHYYFGKGGAWNSMAIAGGLMPGTPVAAAEFALALPPAKRLNVAAIDSAGNLLLWSKAPGLPWSPPVVIAKRQPPGSPLEIGQTTFGPMVSTISSGGKWNVWTHHPSTGWVRHIIGAGFTTGATIACAPDAGICFTIDPLGRLICANWNGTDWSAGYAIPVLDYSPRLVRREVVPNAPLSPAAVTLINTGADPLVVQMIDLFDPRQPPEEKIEAGGQLTVQLPRESGGTLVEVFLVPGPGGLLEEQTASHPIPPEQRFTLTVWSDKETYKVLPFKGAPKGAPKSVTEGFSQRTQVSLGVIPIPAGELLRDGEQMDLMQITQRMKNAGAVVHFPKSVSQP